MTPGNCWAFSGDRGQVTIQLAQKVYLSNLTLQHIPRTISLSGSLDTAPKDFVIYVSTPAGPCLAKGTASSWRGSRHCDKLSVQLMQARGAG